jgi:ubiquinone biosynthesis protein UbiJ
LDSPDRISTSFQKLVLKVTDSIDAQKKVEEILGSISSIETDLRIARAGTFRNEIRSFSEHTSGLAMLMNAVLADLAELRRTVQENLQEISPFFTQAMNGIKQSAELSDTVTRSMNKMIGNLKNTPDRVRQVRAELQPVLLPDGELAGVFGIGSDAVREIAQHTGKARKHVNELQRNLRKLRERTHSLSAAVKLVEDISRRSNLVALNSSLEAPNTAANSTFLDEFKLVSERAGRVQREISEIERSIATEIDGTEASIRELLSETAETLVGTAAAAGFIEQLSPVISALDETPSRLDVITSDHATERERLMKTLSTGYFELEKSTPLLRESERRMESLKQCIENLVSAAEANSAGGTETSGEVADLNFDAGQSNALGGPLEIPGEN